MYKRLSRDYVCRLGQPIINRVDTSIFRKTYFAHCMQCDFCHDSCCQAGVDIDIENVRRLKRHGKKLQAYVQYPRKQWFDDTFLPEPEYPGGQYTRTRVVDGTCVFLNREGRGCLIHAYCLEQGIDYHKLKPLMCCIFPLTFGHGALVPSYEINYDDLACIGPGPNLYQAVRGDLAYYFGDEFVREMDEVERISLERYRKRMARKQKSSSQRQELHVIS
ncbi:MAG: hypothetical protein KatS3mg105_0956 [Gemmatales bacterium]|nr:MAG: hypothetical protein KatS3mg105_0956 [Gemmatales bacterium]